MIPLREQTARPDAEQNTSGKIILYLVTEDWYFLSHRLPMAFAAQRAGYQVHVATRVRDGGGEIRKYGFTLHPLSWKRGSLNPVDLFGILREIRALYRHVAPALVHHVALQPSIIGSLAALGFPMRRVNAVAGLGFGFTSRSLKALLIRPVLAALLRWLMNDPRATVLVQNPDDRGAIKSLGVRADRIFLIPGSGVNTERMKPLPEPDGPITAAFIGRLLDDKGVRSLITAHGLLCARGKQIRLLIAGDRDPANPASITPAEIERWKEKPGIVMAGHVADIEAIWRLAHIAILPSRREGLPKSLLEAAAFGRAIVATDVPGCREIAREGVNAILVPPDDPVALADAIVRLATDSELRRRYAQAGRQIVEKKFSSETIGRQIVGLYEHLLGRNSMPSSPST